MKKRILSILCVLAMVLAMLPTVALAADIQAEVTINQSTTEYETFQEAWNAVKNSIDPFTIKLLDNVTLTSRLEVSEDMTCTLDLNGYTLCQNASNGLVSSYGTLTITDSSADKSGVITSETVYTGNTPGDIESTSGFIGVRGGTFTLSGGTITGIQVADGKQHSVLYIKSASAPYPVATMENGTITGNACSAVSVANGGKFIMNDGEISNNISNSSGGGVLSRWGIVEINGGKIINNQAKRSVWNDSKNGAGGGLADITSGSYGSFSSATSGITLNGSVDISGNLGPDGQKDDILVFGLQSGQDPELYKSYAITVGDAFQAENKIYVSMVQPSTKTIVHASANPHLDEFTLNDDNYAVLSKDDNSIVVKKWYESSSFTASVNNKRLSTSSDTYTKIILGNDQISANISRENPVITYLYRNSAGETFDTFPTEVGTYSVEISYTSRYFSSTGAPYAYKGTRTFYFELVKDQITDLTTLQDCTLEDYYDDADAVIAALPQEITGTMESSRDEITIPVTWTASSEYDATPGAQNSFTWTAQIPDTYEVPQDVAVTGTITVTNKEYTPVTITGTDKAVTYDNAPIDIADMFELDDNAGPAQYSITGGTGEGTLNGNLLTVTKVGTFQIAVTTQASGIYAAGSATATLTVKEVPVYSVEVIDTVGGKVVPSVSSAAEGTDVTLTVTPDKQYALKSLTVTDGDNAEVKLTDAGNGKYTFSMPASGVTVQAIFQKISCDGGEDCPSYEYDDVLKNAWYHEYVDFVVENGYMIGISTEPPVFGTEENLTRAQAIQTLYQMEGRPDWTEETDYDDVSADKWFADAIYWGTENGIIEGRDTGEFDPDAKITREELITIIYRYVKDYKGLSVETESGIPQSFTDSEKVGSYAVDALAWAIDRGIINGITETTLEPQALSRRCEMAKMIATLCAAYPEIP